MEIPSLIYPAKVLLFGEYTIINGGDALVTPYNKLGGYWEVNKNAERKHDTKPFLEYIQSIGGCNKEQARKMIEEDWFFNSTIPTGYGLGSSGALTAATYELLFEKEKDIIKLQKTLARIETYFHGSSSGLDPLASYLQKPLHANDGQITMLSELNSPRNLYIYDSGITRESKPLIKWYKKMLLTDSEFQAGVQELTIANQKVINEVIHDKEYSMTFKEISSLQLNHFSKMIPPSIRLLWEHGLTNDNYYFKLSGAGGGGFFLVYTNDPSCVKGLQSL